MKIIKDGKVEPAIRIESELDSIFEAEDLKLNMIKPVLKRSLYHQGQPVIVSFKAFEVWLVHQVQGQTKVYNPIYTPLPKTVELLTMNTN